MYKGHKKLIKLHKNTKKNCSNDRKTTMNM